MQHQPYLTHDGELVSCSGSIVKHRWGEYYDLVKWTASGSHAIERLASVYGDRMMCSPVDNGHFATSVTSPIVDDNPMRYELSVLDKRSGSVFSLRPSEDRMWAGCLVGKKVLMVIQDDIYLGNMQSLQSKCSVLGCIQVTRIVPVSDSDTLLMTVHLDEPIKYRTLVLAVSGADISIAGELLCDGKSVYKSTMLGDRCVHAVKDTDTERSLNSGVASVVPYTGSVQILQQETCDVSIDFLETDAGDAMIPIRNEVDFSKTVWTAILLEAESISDVCRERVRQHKELADHPPSSVCCGAKAKHRERMLQRAKDIIEQFKSGVAVVDEFSVDDKDKT